MVTNLIAISEKAGHVEEVLQTLSTFYATSVERSIKNLVALLEPFMLLLMGFMVGGIAMAVILPIYQLTSQV
jgi:type IV pilus assembly protein PilC